VPKTAKGFISKWDRDQHFEDHRSEFGGTFATADEYEVAATTFFNAPVAGNMMEGLRPDGWTIRFDSGTNEFAICDTDGYLRTYFKPDPAVHGLADNITYFRRRCIR
jgi:filamentous hemagglutinin